MLLASLWTRVIVIMESVYTKFFWRFTLLGLVVGSLVWGGSTYWMSVVIDRGISEQMESSSDGIICGHLGILIISNRWWAVRSCGHMCRPCRFRLNVFNGALMWSSQWTIAYNVVILVFHLKNKTREEQVWAILVRVVESTPWLLTVFVEGVYETSKFRNVDSVVC